MKKFIISLFLASVLLTCLTGGALAATVVCTGDCHIRSYPSKDASSLGTVGAGSTLDYLYEDSVDYRGVTWYKVNYYGTAGWVSSKYSYVIGGFEYVYGEVHVIDDSNVRQAPSLNATKLGAVRKGTTLDFLGDVSTDSRGVNWYRVVYGSGSGWISSMYTWLEEY